MGLGGAQQRGELAKDIRADRLALERPGGGAQLRALGDRHGEMVRPEGDEPLDQAQARLQLLLKPRRGLRPKQSLLDLRLRLWRFWRGLPRRSGLAGRHGRHRGSFGRRRPQRRHGRDDRRRRFGGAIAILMRSARFRC